jgi:hypothetical protein
MRAGGDPLGDRRRKDQKHELDVGPRKQAGTAEKEESQPFSQGGWPFFSFTAEGCDHPEGPRLSSSVVCTGKTTNSLAA